VEAIIRQLRQVAARQEQQLATLQSQIAELQKRPRSITEEIDAIPGRRIVYTLSGEQSFTSSQDGVRGNPVSMLVSQDGPFVMTHYPLIMWYPNAPSTATNFGRWRPISSWPLPNQQNATAATNADSTVLDVIDISFEIVDGGSQRNFQNLTVAPGLLSRPDNLVPLPVPTLFAPNTTVQVIVTYNNILFSSANTPPTGGNLHIDLPGYRIVNL
jgi:hypothetical protein